MHNTGIGSKPMLREDTLDRKVAIITGGSSGLGQKIAEEFAKLGANITIVGRRQEKLDNAVEEIRSFGGRVIGIQTDVRSPEQVEEMVKTTVREYGKVDILVNNAAGNFRVKTMDMSVNAWNAVINIVLNGTFYCSQAVGKQMKNQNTGGSILNIGSVTPWIGGPYTAHSTSAKAGVLALTKTLAAEWAEHNIRTNIITPGPIEGTGAVSQLFPEQKHQEAILETIPTNRFADMQEIANLASYLVSDYASYITGANYVIDGGGWLNKGKYKIDED